MDLAVDCSGGKRFLAEGAEVAFDNVCARRVSYGSTWSRKVVRARS